MQVKRAAPDAAAGTTEVAKFDPDTGETLIDRDLVSTVPPKGLKRLKVAAVPRDASSLQPSKVAALTGGGTSAMDVGLGRSLDAIAEARSESGCNVSWHYSLDEVRSTTHDMGTLGHLFLFPSLCAT